MEDSLLGVGRLLLSLLLMDEILHHVGALNYCTS